jgi:predicted DNA-binding transcriptional regulator AlpA
VLQFVEDSLHRYLPGSPPGFLRQAIQQYQQSGQGEPARPDPTPRLLTADEVRTVLGSISAMTLHRFMKGGALPVVRISGRRIGFDPEDVRAFVNSRKQKPRGGGRRASA